MGNGILYLILWCIYSLTMPKRLVLKDGSRMWLMVLIVTMLIWLLVPCKAINAWRFLPPIDLCWYVLVLWLSSGRNHSPRYKQSRLKWQALLFTYVAWAGNHSWSSLIRTNGNPSLKTLKMQWSNTMQTDDQACNINQYIDQLHVNKTYYIGIYMVSSS